MRHLRYIGHDYIAGKVFSDRKCHFRIKALESPALYEFTEVDHRALLVGEFYTDCFLARNGGFDPDILGTEAHHYIISQSGDLLDRYTDRHLQFISGNGRSAARSGYRNFEPEALKSILKFLCRLVQFERRIRFVGVLDFIEQNRRRKFELSASFGPDRFSF